MVTVICSPSDFHIFLWMWTAGCSWAHRWEKFNVQTHFCTQVSSSHDYSFSTLTRSLLWLFFFFFSFLDYKCHSFSQPPGWSQPLGFLSSSREDDELENLKYLFTEGPKSTRVTTQSVKLRTEPPRQSLGRSVKSAAAVNPPGFVEHWQFTLAENPSPNLKNIQNGPKCAYLCS